MRSLGIFGVITLLLLPASMSGQSLVELAEKERERREESSKPTAVIDDSDLQEYNQGSSAQPEPPPKSKSEFTKSKSGSSWRRVESASSYVRPRPVKTKAELRGETMACYKRLAEARRELTVALGRLRQGVPILVESTAKIAGTWVSVPYGRSYWTPGPVDNGEPVYYEQGKVSCVMATRNRKRYPKGARTCDAIQYRISGLRAEIANGCDAPN